MRELIDRQAALDVLCDACGNCACPKGKIPRCSYYEKMQAIPAASPWHRVEEPPKENGRYFVSWEGAVTTDEYKNGVWLYAMMFNLRVTHWMPIPEPPKEDA